MVILDQTPFYAESGGVGDKGELKARASPSQSATRRSTAAIGHIGKVASGTLKVGDAVQADVDEARRQRIRLNHSATHLMHAALRQCSAPMWRRKVRWSMIKRCALTSRILKR